MQRSSIRIEHLLTVASSCTHIESFMENILSQTYFYYFYLKKVCPLAELNET